MQLSLEGNKEAFRFLKETLEAEESSRRNVVQFVLDHFAVPGNRSEEAALEYVSSQL